MAHLVCKIKLALFIDAEETTGRHTVRLRLDLSWSNFYLKKKSYRANLYVDFQNHVEQSWI